MYFKGNEKRNHIMTTKKQLPLETNEHINVSNIFVKFTHLQYNTHNSIKTHMNTPVF